MTTGPVIEGPQGRALSPPLPVGTPSKPFPRYTDKIPAPGFPGFVEIKPHNWSGIKAGLEDLAKEKAKREKENKKEWKGKIYLLTYFYRAVPTRDKSEFTGFLLEPKLEALNNAANGTLEAPKVKTGQPGTQSSHVTWLRDLGQWWGLGTHPVPERSFGEWCQVAGGPATGSLLEHPLREKFVQMYQVQAPSRLDKPWLSAKGHLTRDKLASGRGPDVDFLEVAEFLYELEAELGRAA